MFHLIHMTIGDAGLTAMLGYLVVFLGLLLLMFLVMIISKVMSGKAVAVTEAEPPEAQPASGSAGQLKLYDTDPRDAAMIMAIVAHSLGKPLNELRFISIREVKDDEVQSNS